LLDICLTAPNPRSRLTTLAVSLAVHAGVLLIVSRLPSPTASHSPRDTAIQLFVPAAESLPAAAPKMRNPPVEHLVAPPPSALLARLPVPKPVSDLPAPPELSVTRPAPTPERPPLLPAPPQAQPAPPTPVFASARTAVPPAIQTADPRTGSFAAVPAIVAPAQAARLQVVPGAFETVPADTPHRGSSSGSTSPAGFGSPAVTGAANPRRGTAVVPSNGFGGVAVAAAPREPAAKPKTTSTVFTAAVAADPVRNPSAAVQHPAETLEILFKPRPAYTEEARKAHVEGDVVLEVLFTGAGTLRVLRVVRGLGYGLDQNAMDAAAKIRFRPAREDGRAVDTVAMVRISFQIAY
jgi:TonB family protein